MNVEIGAEAAQFPEKEYINGIAVAVYGTFYRIVAVQKIPQMREINPRAVNLESLGMSIHASSQYELT
jgi:hypothetical protein